MATVPAVPLRVPTPPHPEASSPPTGSASQPDPKLPHAPPGVRLPRYCRHAGGQAFVYIRGQQVYLGRHSSPESKIAYHKIIAQWIDSRGQAPPRPGSGVTLAELAVSYLAFLEPRTSESTLVSAKMMIRAVIDTYPALDANELRPVHIRHLHRVLIAKDNCRATIVDRMTRLRMMLRWGIGEDLLLPDVLARVKAVPPPTQRDGARITGPGSGSGSGSASSCTRSGSARSPPRCGVGPGTALVGTPCSSSMRKGAPPPHAPRRSGG